MRRHRGALVAVLVLTSGGLCLALVLVLGVWMGSVPGGSSGCGGDPAGSTLPAGASRVRGLSPAQQANADAVIAEGRRRNVPLQAVVVALAVASQESHFTVYANDGRGGDLSFFQHGIERSLQLPHQAVGTDHGSLGVFQQQWPWWGPMSDLMDPARSAGLFYGALLKVPGWQRMPVTVAAQRVQRSAYPDAYADDEAVARRLLGGPSGTDAVVETGYRTGGCPGADDPGDGRPGRVVMPLPAGSGYADLHNWGTHGARWARLHTGTDLSVPCGTPVLAATSGLVVVRTDQRWAGRWLVEVSTGIGRLTTWYAHMRSLTVSPGASVRAGQQIGEVGDLGNATGCHLHFEVHPRGGSIYQDSVDPTPWLREHVGRDTAEVAPASWSSGPQAFTLATFNVLGGSHTGGRGNEPRMAPGRVRIRGVVRLLEKYGVDVVGLQELQPPQRRAFATATAGRFVTWSPPRDTDNSLAWRRDRWDLVSTGVVPVPYFEGRRRLMPVVRLRDRVTGRESVFVNVHNPADTRDFPHQGHWRAVALAREVALVRRLRSTTGTPVFVTGDMNDHRTVFCRFTASGLTSASNGGSSRHGCHPPQRAGIDWIFGTAGTGFSDHTVDRSALVRATSDHPFVVTRARVG